LRRRTSFNTLVIDSKECLEVFGGEKSSEQRAIVTVGSRAAESDHAGEDENGSCQLWWRFLDHSLLEGFISNGRLDDDDLMLGLEFDVSDAGEFCGRSKRRTSFSWRESAAMMLMVQHWNCWLLS
jgi:hypothetical protein